MKEYKLEDKVLIAVEVRNDATDFCMGNPDEDGVRLEYQVPPPQDATEAQLDYWGRTSWYDWTDLPPGSYSILDRGRDVTADQIKGLPKKYGKMYWDYTSKLNGLAAHSLSELDSFKSWLRSQGINEGDLLIIKMQIT